MPGETAVPNGLVLDRMLLLTGPNMAGGCYGFPNMQQHLMLNRFLPLLQMWVVRGQVSPANGLLAEPHILCAAALVYKLTTVSHAPHF